MPDVKRTRERLLRYYLPLGLLWGGSIVGFAALPIQMWGLVSACLAVSTVVLSRSVRGRGVVARGRVAGWHTAISAGAYIGAFILAATVARGELVWLSWVAALVVCVLCTAGSWLADGAKTLSRPT